MDDPTLQDFAQQPLAEILDVLERYSRSWYRLAMPRITARIERGVPEYKASLRGFDFEQSVLNDAFPERVTEAQRGGKALALAPSVEIYWALMRGERVHWSALEFFQAQRYGLRRRHADGRYSLDDFNDVPGPA